MRGIDSGPSSTNIIQIYDEGCSEILLLGETVSGKTTLLLELANILLQRAQENEKYLMPVVFNLSSWSTHDKSFLAWLIKELVDKYQIPYKIGQKWIEEDLIIPLLDGLDEVDSTFRQFCVDAIDVYRQTHGIVPFVVCSRREEYFNLTTRLSLQRAIYIELLGFSQVKQYFIDTRSQFREFLSIMHIDNSSQEFLMSPLMLHIAKCVFQDQSAVKLSAANSVEQKQKHIVSAYVKQILQYRAFKHYNKFKKSVFWLAYLAKQMKQHN